MSRPLRLEHPGAILHISTRGNERRAIYRSDRDRKIFLELLGKTIGVHRWTLHAWVLMNNHYHLIVETPVPTLSRGMKSLNEQYAENFNWRHRRVGHLVQGRFKAILVERETHLLELVRYVVLNPVRCGAVEHAGDYPWSNYRATAGLTPAPPWLEVEWTRNRFVGASGTREEACDAYRRFVADGRGASYRPWEALVGQIYLGSERFCERMQELVGAKPRSRQHPEAQRHFVRPAFDAVVDEVLRRFDETPETIRVKSHRPARKALAHLGSEEAGVSYAAIGEFLGLTGEAVAHLVARSRAMERERGAYPETLGAIRERLHGAAGWADR